jgi:hypothetical protein
MTAWPRNEQAVREEIIAPVLRGLDYRHGGDNDVRYELPLLRYPRASLGRKKSTDPPIRGKADYVCVAGGRVSWVLEAKPEGIPITDDDVAQAYSYAVHGAVRAIYFCVCNGEEFRVYATSAAPEHPPLVRCDPRDTQAAVATLRPFLGAPALLREFARTVSISQPPIGPGLSSFAEIVHGTIVHEHMTPDLPPMRGFTVFVTGGAIERVADGLRAYWESQAPSSAIQKVVERLGALRVEARSAATQ